MSHSINALMICDKEEDRFILKSFLRQLNDLEIYEIYKFNKIESVLEIIEELEIDLIFVLHIFLLLEQIIHLIQLNLLRVSIKI